MESDCLPVSVEELLYLNKIEKTNSGKLNDNFIDGIFIFLNEALRLTFVLVSFKSE